MAAQAIPFTADGSLSNDGSIGAATPRGGEVVTNSGLMSDEEIVGFTMQGFTSVAIYDGTDNTGTLVAYGNADGTYSWNEPLRLAKGLFIDVTGTGKGSIWIA